MTVEMTESPAAEMKLDDLVQTYIKLRNKKSKLKKEYEEKVESIDELQDKIEALMLLRFQEMGIESAKTSEGTAYVSVRTSASLGDADAFKEFCQRQDDPFTFVDVRVNKSAVLQYKEAMGGELPPGVNFTATRVVNFRSS
jgi:hypothetical protein